MLTGMNPIPWLVGLTLLSNVRTAPLDVKYSWKTVDFTWPTPQLRQDAITSKAYIPENNLPLGLETWNGRTFVTLPKWKPGIPVTLAVIPPNSNQSPFLQPYPSWKWHKEGNCAGLTSVFRMSVDSCGRLWVLDSGVVDVLNTTTQLCPTQIVVFNLANDSLLWKYRVPADQIREGSLFTNIITDVRNRRCDEAFAYITDVFRYGVVVYNWKDNVSWRVSHNLFFPDPIASRYQLDNITFRWTDGVFGVSLSPLDELTQDRTLFFHPMSSFREFAVSTAILRNNTVNDNLEEFKIVGKRGNNLQQSSASVMDRRGVLFFNLVLQNSIGCWDSAKPYNPANIGAIGPDPVTLNFPNDLKLDYKKRQGMWVLTNKLHKYLYTSLDLDEENFFILNGFVDDIVKETVCDPETPALDYTPTCFDDEL